MYSQPLYQNIRSDKHCPNLEHPMKMQNDYVMAITSHVLYIHSMQNLIVVMIYKHIKNKCNDC